VKLYWIRNDNKNISGEMIDEPVTVPNQSYDMNNLSTYKVTQVHIMFHHVWATIHAEDGADDKVW
jgi:hypothetical protein